VVFISCAKDRVMVVGITGTIGSGKTTLAGFFKEWGAALIEADRIGWEILDRPEIREALISEFGQTIVNEAGCVDRRLLGERVFQGRDQLEKLNRIVHPTLLKELKKAIGLRAKESKVVVVDAALIVEWGIADWFDKLIVLTCPESLKVGRLVEGGISEDAARRRLACQLKDEERKRFADFVVDNSGDLEDLRKKGRELFSACGPA